MSNCRDLTSQLAKELTSGIKDVVEDIGAVFRRMAILHPEARVILAPDQNDNDRLDKPMRARLTGGGSATLPLFDSPLDCRTPPPKAFASNDVETYVFAGSTRRRKKQAEPEPDENQLSLFDLPWSA